MNLIKNKAGLVAAFCTTDLEIDKPRRLIFGELTDDTTFTYIANGCSYSFDCSAVVLGDLGLVVQTGTAALRKSNIAPAEPVIECELPYKLYADTAKVLDIAQYIKDNDI